MNGITGDEHAPDVDEAKHVGRCDPLVVRKPESLTFDQAASIWMIFVIAYSALVEDAEIGAGDFVVIDRTFPFDDIVAVHRYIKTNGQFGKIVVTRDVAIDS